MVMTPHQEPRGCCEKCAYLIGGLLHGNRGVCSNSDCPCHHPGKGEKGNYAAAMETAQSDLDTRKKDIEENARLSSHAPLFSQEPQPVEEWERKLESMFLKTPFDTPDYRVIHREKAKSFIRDLLSSNRERVRAGVGSAIDQAWKEMKDRTYNHTMKGKNSPFEVSEEDWGNASFTIEEFKARVLDLLTTPQQ